MIKPVFKPLQSSMFDGDPQPAHRTNDRPEAAALAEVLQVLRHHPDVAFVERMNTGAARVGNRFVRFGFKGCPDVLGFLRDGRFLACEVKGPDGQLRSDQRVFLDRVTSAGGLAFVARSAHDVLEVLPIPHA